MIYEFGRFGTLIKHKGLSLYAGNIPLYENEIELVWWWPLNWIFVLVGLPFAVMLYVLNTWETRKGEKK